MNLQIAKMGIEHGKRGVRFDRTLQLDFFPQIVQPLTGALYAFPHPSYQHFPAMGSDPIETVDCGSRQRILRITSAMAASFIKPREEAI